MRINTKTTIIICLLILNILSILSLYSALHQGGEFTQKNILLRQIVWILIAWIVLLIFSSINYRIFFDLSIILYALSIIFLLLVEILGREAMGAQRWLSIFGINFQPSEFSKIAVIFMLGRLFSQDDEVGRLGFIRKAIFPFSLVLLNALLIIKQPDLGTAVVLIFVFFVMAFASFTRKRYFVILLLFVFACMPLGWRYIKPYQKKRLLVFLNPNLEPLGAGYTITQSKITVGSGKLFGKGFLSGTQNQFNFLPERHTDFIFTVIAEEWGFFGSLFLLAIYFLILRKILDEADKLRDRFAYCVCVGIFSLFLFHICINIGMTMGILPVVGLPLIFMSYGGTNLLISFFLVGVFLNITKQW